MQFKADGTFITTADKQSFKQKWKYDSHSGTLITDEKLAIITINSDSLVLRSSQENRPMTMYLVKVK